MSRLTLTDDEGSFDVTIELAANPSRVVLFAVGGGGNPERHAPLLAFLARRGCTVVAPHFARLLEPTPRADHLLLRARRLTLALDSVAQAGAPVAGVGHSIGAAMLLALAGGQVWMRPGQRLSIEPDPRIQKLVLLAPATGFFRAPGALDGVRTPILAWAASRDIVTPPWQTEFLKGAVPPQVPVELRFAEQADHFSFMNERPPGKPEPLPDPEAFLAALSSEVYRFISS